MSSPRCADRQVKRNSLFNGSFSRCSPRLLQQLRRISDLDLLANLRQGAGVSSAGQRAKKKLSRCSFLSPVFLFFIWWPLPSSPRNELLGSVPPSYWYNTRLLTPVQKIGLPEGSYRSTLCLNNSTILTGILLSIPFKALYVLFEKGL